MSAHLPVLLENLRIATPCQADWDEMDGDERVRFCGRCEKNVYNLSSMTREDAEALVREKEGRLCVRFYQRRDGTVLTADCPVGVQRRRLRQRVWASVSSLAASGALLLGILTGRARADLTIKDGKATSQPKHPVVPEPMPRVLMGAAPMRPEPKVEKKAPARLGDVTPLGQLVMPTK